MSVYVIYVKYSKILAGRVGFYYLRLCILTILYICRTNVEQSFYYYCYYYYYNICIVSRSFFLVLLLTFCSSCFWIVLLEWILILYDNYIKCPEKHGLFFRKSIRMARIRSLCVSTNCKQNLIHSANSPTLYFLSQKLSNNFL